MPGGLAAAVTTSEIVAPRGRSGACALAVGRLWRTPMTDDASKVAANLEKRIRDKFPQVEVEVEAYDFKRLIRWEVTDPKSGRPPLWQTKRSWRHYMDPSAVEVTLESIRNWLEEG